MRKRIFAFFIALCLSIFFISAGFSVPKKAYAAKAVGSLESSYVLDDLMSSTIDGKAFDINDYPNNAKADVEVISFVEYCYSYDSQRLGNYGLYLYVYNPKQIAFKHGNQNRIQMGVSYSEDGSVSSWEKFPLKVVSFVESGEYAHLFYKFRIEDVEVNGTHFWDRVDPKCRRYDFSGIELAFKSEQNAEEYPVGGKYVFEGYCEGYGNSSESSLTCSREDLEFVELDVHSAAYRTGLSDKGNYHYNQLNSVYFSVPERFFDEYGNLESISAEWYEYKTRMALVTPTQEMYNYFVQYKDRNVGWYDTSVPFYLYAFDRVEGILRIAEWSYNSYKRLGIINPFFSVSKYQVNLPYLYCSPVTSSDFSLDIFNFLSKPKAGKVLSNEIKDTIYSYGEGSGNGFINVNGRQFSVDLFEDDVDPGRARGYNRKKVYFDDTFDLKSYDSNHTWWDKFWDFGFSWPENSGQDISDIPPIVVLDEEELPLENLSSELLISESAVDEFKLFYAAEKLKGNDVVLFRFANTDYACSPVWYDGLGPVAGASNEPGYVAQQTVFLDFDVIELEFSRKGKSVVIPAVASPIDIVNDFEDLNDYGGCVDDFLGTLAIILGVAFVVFVVYGIIKLVNFINVQSAVNKIHKMDKPKRRKRRRRR